MPEVSVIVPVFGVELYIQRCLQSLFDQDFSDIEYIFINDCTADKSMDTLYDYLNGNPHRKAQSRIINLESNIGISRVRQLGIRLASGRFIVFCDSDDYIENNMISSLYDQAIKEESDCVLCGYYEETRVGKTQSNIYNSIHGNELIRELLFNHIPGYIWRGLYSRELLSSLVFIPDCTFAEDIIMNVQIWTKATKVTCISNHLYHYCIRENSLSTSRDINALGLQIKSCRRVVAFVTDYLKQQSEYRKSYEDALIYFKRSLVASRFLPQEKYTDMILRKMYKKEAHVNPLSYLSISPKDSPIREKIIFLLDILNILPLLYRIKLRHTSSSIVK